ncbi:MAG: AAA family ATPase [Bacillota bacterium]|nr:AAA family ATPase [Bacillota bacterium]MDW7683519.1 AAA family ATPase [Bacillota bacterium]
MSVRWNTLTLRGFGRYKDEVTISFEPGINVCIEGNEQGKSTLAAGMAAVIYGLPADSNPRAFGQERYRNWYGPSRFEGELEFTAGDAQYRIQRNFETHRISLQTFTDGQWAEIVSGEHNPQARKPNTAYESKITELFGIAGRELFMSTFFITQPIPEGEKIIPEIQQLLSGTGGHYRDALNVLTDELKNITRYTGRAGVTSQDMRQDRRLEKTESQIAEIEQEIQKSESILLELQEVTQDIRKNKERRKTLTALLAERHRLLEAWRLWRTLRDRYDDAVARQGTLGDAQEQAALLLLSVREITKRLETEFAHFLRMPPETGEDLAELTRLREANKQLTAECGQVQADIDSMHSSLNRTNELLQELSAVRGRPSLVRDCLELRKLVAREQEMLQAVDAAVQNVETIREQLAQKPCLDKLGKSPSQSVQSLQRAASRLLTEWAAFRGNMERQSKLNSRLADEYRLFEEAEESLLELLAVYETTRLRLENNLAEAEADRGRAIQKIEETQAARKQYRQSFGDLERLGEDAPGLVSRKIELLEAQKREEDVLRNIATVVSISGRKAWVGAFFAALAAGAALFTQTDAAVPALAASAGTGLLVYLILRLLSGKQKAALPQEKLGEINIAMRQVDMQLGTFASLGATQLGELRERLRQREAMARRLAELEAEQPDDGTLAVLKQTLDTAQAEYRAFTERTAEAANHYGDIPAAFADWRDTARQASDLRKQTTEFAKRHGISDPAGLFASPAEGLSDPWPEVTCLAGVFNIPVGSVEDVLNWLENLDDNWWSNAVQEAAAFEKLSDALRDAQHELTALTGLENRERLETLKAEIDAMRKLTAPFDEQTDSGELAQMLKKSAAAEEEYVRQQAALEAAGEKKDQLNEKQERLAEKQIPLQERLALLLETGDAPEVLLEQWRHVQELKRERSEDEKKLAGILSAHGVSTADELRNKASDATNRAIGLFNEWDKLQSDFPSLPGTKESDPARLESSYRELESEVARLQEEEETLHGDVRELELRLARLQGNAPLNIAAGKARLRELLQERDRLQRESAAIEVAYREMAAAIDDFSLSYRQEFADKTTEYFTKITGVAKRHIQVEEDFSVKVVEDGRTADVSQLSQGARDQLYISLRLAIADLLAGDSAMPFIFDDPFLNWDQQRCRRIRSALAEMEGGRQILLLSHSDDFTGWGKQCRKQL